MLKDEVQRWIRCKNLRKWFSELSYNNVILENSNEQNHEKCDEKVFTRQKISNCVKRKAVDDISLPDHQRFDISTLTTKDVILIV